MNVHTEIQTILQNGIPAFVVLPVADYEALLSRHGEKRSTFPHEVVKMNLQEGYSLLKAWRVYFKIGQTDLAKKAGVTQSQVANFENGKTIPRADTLLKLSDALGVSADLLWDEDAA
jgi:DNA-binding XRE family transcriptional regulator